MSDQAFPRVAPQGSITAGFWAVYAWSFFTAPDMARRHGEPPVQRL